MLLVHQYMVKVLDLISFVYYVYKYDSNSLFQFLGIAKNNLHLVTIKSAPITSYNV